MSQSTEYMESQVLSQALHAQFFLKKQRAGYTKNIIKGPVLCPTVSMAENPKVSTGKEATLRTVQGS